MAARIRQPRNFRTRLDFLNVYNDVELRKRYKLDRAGVMFVTDLVRDIIQNRTERSQAVSAEMKVALTLRYLATGKFQQCNADDFGLSQPTISRVITQTLEALVARHIIRRFIVFPRQPQEIQQKQEAFREVTDIPGVVGVIDGTHVKIEAPREHEEVYVNRKNEHSINTQVVFDAKGTLIDMVANWPGSTHDSRMLRNSGLWYMFEHNLVPRGCCVLGDSGYPLKPWLMTPILRPQNEAEESYNRDHRHIRSLVERCIGQLKRRFPVLRGEIRLAPKKAAKVILACGILYNICKLRNIPLEDDEEEEDADDIDAHGDGNMEEMRYLPNGEAADDGRRIRNFIVDTYFRNEG